MSDQIHNSTPAARSIAPIELNAYCDQRAIPTQAGPEECSADSENLKYKG